MPFNSDSSPLALPDFQALTGNAQHLESVAAHCPSQGFDTVVTSLPYWQRRSAATSASSRSSPSSSWGGKHVPARSRRAPGWFLPPFAGSNTALAAAQELEFRAVGVDLMPLPF